MMKLSAVIAILALPVAAHAQAIYGLGGGSGGNGAGTIVDPTTFASGTSRLQPSGGLYQTSATSNALTNGQMGMTQMTSFRATHVNLRDATGAEIGIAGKPLVASISGLGAAADEAAFSFGSSTFPNGVVYQTTATNNPLASGQYGMLQGTAYRASHVNLRNASGVEIGTNSTPLVVSSTAGGLADEASFTFGTTVFPTGVVYQTTATSNPLTTGQIGQLQGTANRAAHVNLRTAAGAEIGTAASPLVAAGPTDESAFTAGTSPSGLTLFYQTTATSNALTTGQQGAWQGTANRAGFVNLRNASGTELGTATTPVVVTQQAGSSNGSLVQSAIVPNNTTSVAVGTSAAHTLLGVDGFSISSNTPAFVKFYNAAQGSVTCGSGTPTARYMIPASGGTTGSGEIMHDVNGIAFSTALTYCVTTGLADNDTTAPAASTYVLNLIYK